MKLLFSLCKSQSEHILNIWNGKIISERLSFNVTLLWRKNRWEDIRQTRFGVKKVSVTSGDYRTTKLWFHKNFTHITWRAINSLNFRSDFTSLLLKKKQVEKLSRLIDSISPLSHYKIQQCARVSNESHSKSLKWSN